MSKIKILSLRLTEQDVEKIEIVKRNTGAQSTAEAIRNSLYANARFLEPAYISKKQTIKTLSDDPIQREKQKLEQKQKQKEAERIAFMAGQTALADQLHNAVWTPKNGSQYLEWPVYEKIGSKIVQGKRGTMLEDITETHIKNQFRNGTREEILAILEANE